MAVRNARRIGADRRRRAKLKDALNALRDIITRHGLDASSFDQVSILYSTLDLLHKSEEVIESQHAMLQELEKSNGNHRPTDAKKHSTNGRAARRGSTPPSLTGSSGTGSATTSSSLATTPALSKRTVDSATQILHGIASPPLHPKSHASKRAGAGAGATTLDAQPPFDLDEEDVEFDGADDAAEAEAEDEDDDDEEGRDDGDQRSKSHRRNAAHKSPQPRPRSRSRQAKTATN
jgi:hypothetical protein